MTGLLLKQRLLERRAHLAAELADREADPMDELQDRTMREFAVARLNQDASRCAEVDAALARMDGGKYGLCATCGHRIATKRLMAVPCAVLCVNCQYKADTARSRRAA